MRSSKSTWLHKLILLTSFCCFGISAGQEIPLEKTSLKILIPQLEEQYEVRFSYREKDIENIKVSVPDSTLNFEDVLFAFEAQSPLEFEIINKRYIAITREDATFSLCGTVKDSQTDMPLFGAVVYTNTKESSAITDEMGRFVLDEITLKDTLEVTFLGYEPLYIKRNLFNTINSDCVELHMKPFLEFLDEAVVTSYLTSGISKKIDGTTTINTERFGTLPGLIEPDALQTVENLPGVESVNETVSNINIRGGTSDQNLILFDGVKMYLTGHFFGLISAFNPALTTKVDLAKNGTSAEYSDGVSGTVKIQSKNDLLSRWAGGAGFNLVSADAYLQAPITEKLEIHYSGRRSINDLVNTPTYNNYFSRTFQDSEISPYSTVEGITESADFYYYDTSLKILYDLNEQHQARFSLINVYNDLEHFEATTENLSEELRESSLSQHNIAFGANWSAQWNQNLRTETSSYITRYRLDALNYTSNTDQRLLQKNEVLESGLKFKATRTFGNTLELLNGYQFYEVGVSNIENLNNPFFSSRIKNVIRSHSAFSEISYSRKNTFIRGGIRFNYLGKFREVQIEPRFTYNQQITRDISFKAQAEAKSQTTSQIIDLQDDFLGVENRRWILSDNETFPIIKSRQASLGFDYKSNGWYLDLEAFRKIVEGISTSNQGFQNQHEFSRTAGSYTVQGLEFLVNKRAGAFSSYLTYTYAKNNYNFPELSPHTFPNNFDIRHSFSLAANYSLQKFKFSLGGHLRSGKPYTEPIEGNETRQEGNNRFVNYKSPNSERLPNFSRIDFSASYNIKLSKNYRGTISLGLINLLNRKNILNRYYRVDMEEENNVIQVDNTSLGFTPNVLLRIKF